MNIAKEDTEDNVSNLQKDNESPPKPLTNDESNKDQDTDVNPGERIRQYRKLAGLSQRQLAAACEPPLDFTTIGQVERTSSYTASTLQRIAKALNCKISDFFLDDDLAPYYRLPKDMKQEIKGVIRRYAEAASTSNYK